MIEKFIIKNYKSIDSLELDLGRINVFIGENGSGKTNVLEAIGMLSAAKLNRLNLDGLYSKGIRIATTNLLFSAFKDKNNKIKFNSEEILLKDIIDISCFYEREKEIFEVSTALIENEDKSDTDQHLSDLLVQNYLRSVKSNKNYHDRIHNSENIVNELRKEFINESNHEKKHAVRGKLFTAYKDLDYLIEPLAVVRGYVIYNLNIKALRGEYKESLEKPVGINGEGLDFLISIFAPKKFERFKEHTYLISWLEDIIVDKDDNLKSKGYRVGKSTSRLYFKDKFMSKNSNIITAENSNDGILHILFYLGLFISSKTPKFFAIDNIETSLNPHLCTYLMMELVKLAKDLRNQKQALITTHNPAVLDGLNLMDDDQRLFEVYRNDEGRTKVRRIKFSEDFIRNKKEFKLSEMWTRGLLGGISKNF